MASIISSGIGSGLDINGLVTQLVAAEGQPASLRLNRQEAVLQAKLSATGVLKSALAEFQSAMQGLADLSKFQSVTATSGNSDLFTAAAADGAVAGAHSVKVVNLAQAQKLASKAFTNSTDAVGTGTLTFSFGTYNSTANTFTANPDKASQSVVIGSANNSLEGIRDAVNKAGIGVTASIVDDGSGKRLVFASNDSGVANSLKITVSGDSVGSNVDDAGLSQLAFDPTAAGLGSGKNLTETVAAKDAKIEVDGLTITRPNNTITGVIEGVTLTLKKEDATSTVSLSVAKNPALVSTKVGEFVSSFNKLKNVLKNLTKFDAKTGEKGELLGDATLRGIEAQIRRLFTAPVEGVTGSFRSLASIGITTQSDGALKLDTTALTKAIDADSDAVARLFAKSGVTTDALVKFSTSTDASLAGTFAVNLTQLATQGKLTGSATAGFPLTIDGANDNFTLKVDGISSGTISLTQGSFASGAALAAEIQSRVNGDGALKAAGASVAVSFVTNHFEITSTRYGSASKVEILTVDSNSSSLGFSAGAGADGVDVAGTLGGVAATGSGQTLTGTGAAAGIAITVLGGALGERGAVSFARGVSVKLDALLKETLGADSGLTSKIEGLNKQISRIGDQREILDRRLTALQERFRAQFTALDSLLGRLQSTSTFLAQQLASLPGARKSS